MYGHLTLISGPMYASKTTELLKRVLQAKAENKRVLSVKPAFDNRYSESKIVSHDGLSIDAESISSWENVALLAANADLVCIDEVQFFIKPHFSDDIIEIVRQLLCVGTEVVVTGLDLDWQGEPFKTTALLGAMADDSIKPKANCTVCGKPAAKTHKKVPNNEQIELGASEMYEARCNTHWGL